MIFLFFAIVLLIYMWTLGVSSVWAQKKFENLMHIKLQPKILVIYENQDSNHRTNFLALLYQVV